jgi:thiol-disulfide isomerase/thioredoxin
MKRVVFAASILLLLSCKKEAKEPAEPENDHIEVVDFQELEKLLQQQEEEVLLVNFWATWCKPCVEELPYFEEVHDSLGGSGLKVILVSLDFPNKLESQVIPFVRDKGLEPQVILLDDPHENDWIPKVDSTWSGAIPATLFLKEGKRKFFEKSFTRTSLFSEVSQFINP